MYYVPVGVGVVIERHGVLDGELREMARYFHALKDVLRLRILITLAASGEMTVTELAQALHVSQPLVSFHLRPLRAFELVQVRRCGRKAHCSINLPEIRRRQNEFVEILVKTANLDP
jgi:DNA-binding transcriptional ArsR family regulator